MTKPPEDPDKAKEKLIESAEKALEMKKQAGPQTAIPEHRTEHSGGVDGSQMPYSDTRLGKEGTWEANLKRSHNPRVGDTGKTTGPGRRD